MRLLKHVVAIALIAHSAWAGAQAPPAHPLIFRQVSFQPFAPITLGQPVPAHAPRTVLVGSGRYMLAVQRFGDADSIFVDVTRRDTVTRLEFVYPASKDVHAALADYHASLGSPVHVASDSAGGRLDRWVWRDSETTFEFSTFRVAAGEQRVWSAVSDRRPSMSNPPN